MRARTAVAAGLLGWMSVSVVAAADPPAGVRRFALVVGANSGGSNRPRLKFAVSDAARFARVLVELGGVAPADAVVLEQPSLRALTDGLSALRTRVQAARGAAGEGARTEALVYYSGHADEQGLLLGNDRYSYRSLREQMDEIPADVRIAVLDACASGAITRLKGGEARQPFLVDASSSMRGHAFLTSSSADEAAQESDRLGASFFTHYLISGLRGAADVTGEGTVTLSEAYQFAFRETLGRTADTRGGAQHPSYDINLSGTGDVVMTDLRQTSAGLVLAEELAGRCFVRDSDRVLVVELKKSKDRRVELGLAPGRYEVGCQDEAAAFVARPVLEEGQHVVLGARDFSPTRREVAVARGPVWRPSVGALDGRSRVDLRSGADSWMAGTGYTRWIRPDLALGLTFTGVTSQGGVSTFSTSGESSDVSLVTTSSSNVTSLFASVRRDLIGHSTSSRVRPYVGAGLGTYVRTESATRVQSSRVTEASPGPGISVTERSETVSQSHTSAVRGAFQLEAGLGFQLNRRLIIEAWAAYDLAGRFKDFEGERQDYSGFQVGIGLGWLFGKGTPPARRDLPGR